MTPKVNATEQAQTSQTVPQGGEEAHEGPPELENFWNILAKVPALNKEGSVSRKIIKPFDPYVHDKTEALLHQTCQSVFFGAVTAILVIFVLRRGLRRRAMIPSRGQSAVEMFIEGLNNFFIGILGEKYGPRYVPFLLALFIFIMANNLMGLVPFMKSSTSMFQLNIVLGISVFLYVQYTALRYLGPKKYLLHMMNDPDSIGMWIIGVFLLPLHIISELVRPLSLSLRLFGNVLGEDVLLGVFATLGITLTAVLLKPLGWEHPWIGIPLHLPFMFLATLTGTIQALIFSLLSCVYILLVLPHEEGGAH